MARKGENIYKRKDGRWEARYEKGRNSKGQIIYGSLYGKSYREVKEKKINSIVKLPVTKTISPSESLNICDISTRWLESIRHTVKESTYSCYLTLIQKHILTYFNNNSMITSEHIQQFINYKITNDLSPASVRNIVVLLERILRYGEDENLLPVTKRSFTFPKSSFYINDTLDASQLSILARYLYLEGDAFSIGLLLCMHTGIRIGELCGLKGGDFNFTNETFEIHRTISRIRNTESTPDHQDAKTKVIIGTPKSSIFFICMDVICHGAPSPALWREYVQYQEKKSGGKLKGINFRCKDESWIDFGMKGVLEDIPEGSAKRLYISKDKDPYMQMFLRDYCLRPACYECVAKREKMSDLTVADFWGINDIAPEMNDGLGISLVLIRTQKGKEIFNYISCKMKLKEVTYEAGVKGNPAEYKSCARPSQRDTFFDDMHTMSFEELEGKYAAPIKYSLKTRAKRKVKKIIKNMLRVIEGAESNTEYGLLFVFRV